MIVQLNKFLYQTFIFSHDYYIKYLYKNIQNIQNIICKKKYTITIIIKNKIIILKNNINIL